MQGPGSPSPAMAGLISVLEADFRQLSHDARKTEGFASFFSNSDSQPDVKEAAERAVMKIRALADHPNALDQIRSSKELMKPLLLSCDTKSARLISQSLATVQKMVSNDALSPDSAESVIAMLLKVEKMSDEGVQLKVLQTALTLLQSPLHPTSEDDIGTVLGMCFRSLTQKGRKDTVTNTAAATVRQSVAIVFTYVDVAAEMSRLERLKNKGGGGGGAKEENNNNGVVEVLAEVTTIDDDDAGPSSVLVAAQKLLEDLIAIATGAPPTWLKTSSLPRTFILEVLDFALANSSDLFMSLPEFQTALSLRISQLLQAQLQDYLDAGVAGAQFAASSFPAFKAILRCVRTLLVKYHAQIGGRCGTLIQTMLRGLGVEHPPIQRIAVAQLVNQLLEDAPLVYFLFVTYDMQKERKIDAVHALVRGATDVLDASLRNPSSGSSSSTGGGGGGASGTGGSSGVEEDGSDAIGAVFQSRSSSKDWSLDTDYEGVAPAAQHAYLGMLALDSLLHFIGSVEVLTYAATEGGGELRGGDWYALSPREKLLLGSSRDEVLPHSSSAPEPLLITREACAALVERTWRASLAVLNQMLSQSVRETMILYLLKSYQGFTQACGVLELEEPRDAFLGALCQLALASDRGNAAARDGGGRAMSPTRMSGSGGGGGDGGEGSSSSPRSPNVRDSSMVIPSPHRSTALNAPSDMDAGIVLTPKNVQAMRTLFNIAHRLANVLGPGWALILETLNTLDRVLNSPKTTTQDAGAGNNAGSGVNNNMGGGGGGGNSYENALSSDLSILSAAASQLFECTRDMSREAVVALLSGLRDVSLSHMPHATQVSQPKMFALGRMVDVLLFNVHRIYDLWGIFLTHVLEVVDDPKPPVRAAAIEALGTAIVGALGSLPSTTTTTTNTTATISGKSPSPSPGGSGGGSRASTQQQESTGGLEHMLLVALEALHNDERERDVRIGVLRVLLAVLQRHGERLTDGWTPVFRLLAVVPGQEDPETVSLGFQSLQLTATDYMSAMPFPRLKRCLEVAVAYGKQQTDLNVSLTTISLLWNVGDMLSRSGSSSGSSSSGSHRRSSSSLSQGINSSGMKQSIEDSDEEGTQQQQQQQQQINNNNAQRSDQLTAVTTAAQAEELLEVIFSALQVLSQDPRPEVRNSGARTLFAVVVTQGPRLSRVLWERCLWELLFPLLRHAFHMSATSSKEEAEATLLGRSRGAQVRLVMHHSRNTEQKQWDETVAVDLGGMSRLLRAHLPAIAAMEGMEAGWDELMIVAESSLAGGRKEVALAAIGLLGGVLGAHGGDNTVISDAMWRRALRAIDVGVEAAISAGCLVPLTARTELVNLVGSLYTSLKPRFSMEDTAGIFRWIEAFSRNPWSEDDASNPVQTIGMPPVQKATLALLPNLAPDHLPLLWPMYLLTIARLVQPAHVAAAWQELEEAAAAAAKEDAEAAAAGFASGGGGVMPPETPVRVLLAQPAVMGATAGPLGTGSNGAVQPPPKYAQHRFALNSGFLEKVIAVLVQVFEVAPAWVRAVTLGDIAKALGKCMELRFTVYQERIWRCAATALNHIMPCGIAAVNTPLPPSLITDDPEAAIDVVNAWSSLADVFENFLLGEAFQRGELETKTRAAEEKAVQDAALPPVVVVAPEAPPEMAAPPPPPPPRRGLRKLTSSSKAAAAAVAPSTSSSTTTGNASSSSSVDAAAAALASASVVDAVQSRADVDLELSILDTLADVVLTECGTAPLAMTHRLISVVDRGIARPRELSIPQTVTGSNFSHVCVRKMYVLCSRAGGAAAAAVGVHHRQSSVSEVDPMLLVARTALPMFLSRCDTMLRLFAEEARTGVGGNSSGGGAPVAPSRPRLDEIMCVLEVIASMSLAPSVVDAVLPPDGPITSVVAALRSRPEVAHRGRERTHLLLLYSSLCGCVTCKEPRVREMVRDVLGLAGAELGLSMFG